MTRELLICFTLILLVATTSCAGKNKQIKSSAKKGQFIGKLMQTESAERLRAFPVSTFKKHRETLKDWEVAKVEKHFIHDPRAISWGFYVNNLGKMRKIEGVQKDFFNGVSMNLNKKFSSLYHNEILVSQGDKEYWLPIQDRIISFYNKEVKKGELFFVEVRYFGNYFIQSKNNSFFMLIDFQTKNHHHPSFDFEGSKIK